jgi:hypothetical protein
VTLIVPNPPTLRPPCGSAPDGSVFASRASTRRSRRWPTLWGVDDYQRQRRGGPDPARLDQVPPAIRSAAGFEVDGGVLPGVPSTVIDVTGREPRIIRGGAGGEATLAALA